MGAVTNAATTVGIPDLGYDGIGIDDVAEGNMAAGTGKDLQWDYSADRLLGRHQLVCLQKEL